MIDALDALQANEQKPQARRALKRGPSIQEMLLAEVDASHAEVRARSPGAEVRARSPGAASPPESDGGAALARTSTPRVTQAGVGLGAQGWVASAPVIDTTGGFISPSAAVDPQGPLVHAGSDRRLAAELGNSRVLASNVTAKKVANTLHKRKGKENRKMAELILPIERDGLVANLYAYLGTATDNQLAGLGDSGTSRFSALRVPDTIVMRNGLIHSWFFTAKSGALLRKNRAKLNREEVTRTFRAKGAKNRTGVIAVYLTSSSTRAPPGGQEPSDEGSDGPPMPTTPGRPKDVKTHTPTVHCDYLDKAGLAEFLETEDFSRNGVLQAFIEPNTVRMSTIEATWSPATTLIERRVNVNEIDDPRFPVVERMVTFDGAEHYSDLLPVQRAATNATIKAGCAAIKAHLSGVYPSYLNVGRMVLQLREDRQRRVWLLWCTSFRCTPTPGQPTMGPLTLHTRLTVTNQRQEEARPVKPSPQRKRQREGKAVNPTTGVVVQEPRPLQVYGAELSKLEGDGEEERRHLVYNVPPVGLHDVLFAPGAALDAGHKNGYTVADKKPDDDADESTGGGGYGSDEDDGSDGGRRGAALSTTTRLLPSENHRATRLTKNSQLAEGGLYRDALLICKTAPDLESLKSSSQRQAERVVRPWHPTQTPLVSCALLFSCVLCPHQQC